VRRALIVLVGLAACGPDTTAGDVATFTNTQDTHQEVVLQEPGIVAVAWTFPGGATCESTGVASLAMRVFLGDTVAGSLAGPCIGDSGSLILANLQPGRYDVVVDGLDGAGTNTRRGTVAGVVVTSNETTQAATELTPRGAELDVAWDIDGLACGDGGVVSVELEVYAQASTVAQQVADDEDDCEDDHNLFSELAPSDDVAVVATGFDKDGNEVAGGSVDGITLGAGERRSVTVTLTAR